MQILIGIDRGVVNTDLVVQVRARTVARRTYIAEDVSTMDILSRNHCEAGKMGIQGLDAVAVIDDDFASVSGTEAGLHDGSIRRRPHSVALVGGDVYAGVERAFPVKWVQAGAERTGHDPLPRPLRRRIGKIHHPAENRRE